MGLGWEFKPETVARANGSAVDNTRHHPTAQAGHTRVSVAFDRATQTGHEPVKKDARLAKPGKFKLRIGPNMQDGASWQRRQIRAQGRDIFSEIPRMHVEPHRPQFGEQTGIDQVNLTQVRAIGRISFVIAMLRGNPGMGITVHSQPGNHANFKNRGLGEAVLCALADGNNVRVRVHCPDNFARRRQAQ